MGKNGKAGPINSNELVVQNVQTLFSFEEDGNYWIRPISIDYLSIDRGVNYMTTILRPSGVVSFYFS